MKCVYYVGIGALTVLLSVGCAYKTTFFPGPMTPAAEATARVSRDANDNTKLKLHVEHLALPKRLSTPRAFYVVWAQTPQGRAMNLGRLMVKTDKTGSFTSVIPLEQFRLLITAEDEVDAVVPSEQIVLSTEVLSTKDLKTGFWNSLMPSKTTSP